MSIVRKSPVDRAPVAADSTAPVTKNAPPGLPRRDLVSALFGVVGAGAAASVLAACATEAAAPPGGGEKLGHAAEASSSTTLAWVDTVLGAAPPATRIGDLALNNGGSAGVSGALIVIAKGCVSAGDGGGGLFFWDSSSTSGDDGGTIIVPASPTGRWVRLYSGGLDVRWFGADAKGVADSTQAIQNAINAVSSGGVVRLSAGTYLTSATLTIGADGVALVGEGYLATLIHGTGTGAILGASSRQKLIVSGIDFDAYSTSPNTGIALSGVLGAVIERCRAKNMSLANSAGIALSACNDVSIRDSFLENVNGNGIILSSASNNCRVQDCSFNAQSTSMNGVLVSSGTEATYISGNNFEGNSSGNVGVFCSGSAATVILGNYFELWTGACVAANAGVATDLVIQGNSMQATSSAAALVVLNSTGPNDRVAILHNHFVGLGTSGYASTGIILGSTTHATVLGNGPPASGTVIHAQSTTDLIVGDLPVSGAGLFGDRVQVSAASTMYSGTGSPSSAVGADGDYFLRSDTPGVSNQRIYVKSSGAWVGIV